jgi:hypothetical protein
MHPRVHHPQHHRPRRSSSWQLLAAVNLALAQIRLVPSAWSQVTAARRLARVEARRKWMLRRVFDVSPMAHRRPDMARDTGVSSITPHKQGSGITDPAFQAPFKVLTAPRTARSQARGRSDRTSSRGQEAALTTTWTWLAKAVVRVSPRRSALHASPPSKPSNVLQGRRERWWAERHLCMCRRQREPDSTSVRPRHDRTQSPCSIWHTQRPPAWEIAARGGDGCWLTGLARCRRCWCPAFSVRDLCGST